jgi:hypothetical protein
VLILWPAGGLQGAVRRDNCFARCGAEVAVSGEGAK